MYIVTRYIHTYVYTYVCAGRLPEYVMLRLSICAADDDNMFSMCYYRVGTSESRIESVKSIMDNYVYSGLFRAYNRLQNNNNNNKYIKIHRILITTRKFFFIFVYLIADRQFFFFVVSPIRTMSHLNGSYIVHNNNNITRAHFRVMLFNYFHGRIIFIHVGSHNARVIVHILRFINPTDDGSEVNIAYFSFSKAT